MPWYRTHGKLLTPMTDEQFSRIMKTGHFVKQVHKGFLVLIWYTAIRRAEALRSLREQYKHVGNTISFSVGIRMKHGIETAPLPIPVDAPHVIELVKSITQVRAKTRVFKFSPMTAYNICNRLGYYPHYFRLSRITRFFNEINPATGTPWTIAQVHSWTGLTIGTLSAYLGLVDVSQMGKSLGAKKNA